MECLEATKSKMEREEELDQMQELEIEETNASSVPQRFACPVCGKWGRNDYSYGFPSGFLHCKTNARRGGKGCGEIFRHITPDKRGCLRIAETLDVIDFDQKVINAGYFLIELMKKAGIHDQFRRKIKTGIVLDLVQPIGGSCGCGCGKELPHPSSKYANHLCSQAIFEAAWMLTNQDQSLRKFLIKLRGQKCECCNEPKKYASSLEIDHIVEVKQGGGLCWIDNFQLLCSECHKAKTAKFAADRANQRKAEKQLATGQQSLFV